MEMNVLKPTFYDRFQCLCGDCKYTCCQEWGITLTKEEYTKIEKAEKSEKVKAQIDNTFYRVGKGGSYKRYAKVIFGSDDMCGCLAEGGLCALQMECGYETLPRICKIFPRNVVQYKNMWERSLSAGCEKVVSLLIEEKDGIVLENGKETINLREQPPNFIFNNKYIEKYPIVNYYYDIKTLGLAILENRDYTLDERMVLLGMAIQKIDTIDKEQDQIKIPSFVDEFLESIEDTSIINSFGGRCQNYNLKVFDAVFTAEGIVDGLINTAAPFHNVINKVYDSLGVIIKEPKVETNIDNDNHFTIKRQKRIEFNTEKYNLAQERFQKFFEGREYILENIMVNNFLFNNQPFYNQKFGVWDNFMFFASIYNITKLIIMGYIDENSTDDDLIHCVTVLSRRLTHSQQLIESLVTKMKENGTDTLAHMALLIL